MVSKSLVFNDDFSRQQDHLGQSPISKPGEPSSGKSGTAEVSLGLNVPFTDKNPAAPFMADGTFRGERREDPISPLIQHPPSLLREVEPGKLTAVSPGPLSQTIFSQPMGLNRGTLSPTQLSNSATLLGGLEALTPGAKHSKPRIRSQKNKKKGPNSILPIRSSAKEVNPSTCETVV
ncbi:hypothetical protein Ancab_026160 [Ancistrocladus abbreviatus]